ncbi:AraC family transcriptional regulator, partial [Vibrio parahaemolyticus]|nr:AraC family transcriptional regulator [Vibrio parahaemolyticus]
LIGYSDPLYFSRVFKNKAGLSPKLYREKVM